MVKPEIIEEKPLSLAGLKKMLKEIKERDGELNFRANKAEDYLNQFVILSDQKGRELARKLVALEIPRLKPGYISKVVDILPVTVDDLKILFQGYAVSISQGNMKKIVDTVKEFLP